jgi:hypothetical protein
MNSLQSDPWAEIRHEFMQGTLRARRVDASHPHDFFWGLDAKGQKLLILRFSSNINRKMEMPSINGISLELEDEQIFIRLTSPSDTEIFTSLCWSLIDRTRYVGAADKVLEALFAHLFRWQKFLGKMSRGLLSNEEVRGLFCELSFLKDQLISRYGSESVLFWHGPSKFPQDFAVGLALFEVKGHLSSATRKVLISSADQLWCPTGALFLTVYSIGLAPASNPTALSLKQLVDEIRSLLPASLSDVFEDKLFEQGYTDHPEYDKQHFVVSNPDFFEVSDGFPRITPQAILPGIDKVQYTVELAACDPFRREPKWEAVEANHDN